MLNALRVVSPPQVTQPAAAGITLQNYNIGFFHSKFNKITSVSIDPEGTGKPLRDVCFTARKYDVQRRWQ
jgi:hypothetical protein